VLPAVGARAAPGFRKMKLMLAVLPIPKKLSFRGAECFVVAKTDRSIPGTKCLLHQTWGRWYAFEGDEDVRREVLADNTL
jgi:hypothetical protein